MNEACKTNTTKHQPHQSSNTQQTENKMTDVVIHQHSRKLLKMDILMSETCWAHDKWNKITSDIKLVFHSSTNPATILAGLYLYTFYFRFILPKHIANFIFHVTEWALNFTRENGDSNWLSICDLSCIPVTWQLINKHNVIWIKKEEMVYQW